MYANAFAYPSACWGLRLAFKMLAIKRNSCAAACVAGPVYGYLSTYLPNIQHPKKRQLASGYYYLIFPRKNYPFAVKM